jgi:hypothetical protein
VETAPRGPKPGARPCSSDGSTGPLARRVRLRARATFRVPRLPTEAGGRRAGFKGLGAAFVDHLIYLLNAISARVSVRRPDMSLRATIASRGNTAWRPERLLRLLARSACEYAV